MVRSGSKMTRSDAEESQDLISNLPEEMKAKVLSLLPIREAVRTSVLSSKWRSIWASMPEITIADPDFAPLYEHNPRPLRPRLVKFVDILLLLHKGPIQKFQMETGISNSDAFNRWILKLSRTGIRAFVFDLTSPMPYKVSSSLFSCNSLQFLHLRNCIIKLPRSFEGLKAIHTIELQNCEINGEDLEKLVSKCPLLNELSVKALYGANMSLVINGPKLTSLIVDSNFANLALKTPCLVKACIELDVTLPGGNSRNNLIAALGDLPDLESLGIHNNFLPYLAKGNIPDRFSARFNKLKWIQLDTDLSDSKEANVANLIFGSSPILEELLVLDSSKKEATINYGLWVTRHGVYFEMLRTVTLDSLFVTGFTFEFLKFVLGSAPRLEKLIIYAQEFFSENEKEAFLQHIMMFPKESRNVQIKFA